ncbi:Cell division protein FtsA [bacterium HR40]|nr:Cell division protein FtsA [bacterium HR40]
MTALLAQRPARRGRAVPLAGVRTTPVAVVDVGTTKISCFFARPRPSRGFTLLGRGYQSAEGFRAGEVIDVAAAETSIAAALQEAEEQAGEQIRDVLLVTSAGGPVARFVRVRRPIEGGIVRDTVIEAALREARAIGLEPGREALHCIALEARVDDSRPLRDPRGSQGRELDLLATVVTTQSQALATLVGCLERCHVRVAEIVAAPYASGLACASEDELERGVLVLDMGGGQTGIAHFADGRLVYLDRVPYGGEHVTADVVYGLSTTRRFAERLKTLYGSVQPRASDDNARLEVPLVGEDADQATGEVPRAKLTRIVRARVEEILEMVEAKIRANWEMFDRRPPRSVVLTGGASQVDGIEELVEEIFGIPARRGRPMLVHGRDGIENQPCCAAACGGLLLATGDDEGLRWSDGREMPAISGWLARFARWLEQNF